MVADKDRIVGQNARPAKVTSPKTVLGVELVTLDPSSALWLGLPKETRGAAVIKLDPNSPLTSYLRQYDVIQTVAGRNIQSAEEVVQALGTRRAATDLDVTIQRHGEGGMQLYRVRVP